MNELAIIDHASEIRLPDCSKLAVNSNKEQQRHNLLILRDQKIFLTS